MEISKISRVVKDQDEFNKIKKYLSTVYKHLRETYKYFAAISSYNNVFRIGQLIFQEIINNTKILDKELLTNSDLDLEYITTNVGIIKYKFNPDRALIRC
jgi:tetrahydromethanopterin S-methyltransferase subunit G